MGPIQTGFNLIRSTIMGRNTVAQNAQANVTGAAAISGGGESKLVREASKERAEKMVRRMTSENPLLDGLIRVGKVNEKPKKEFHRRGKFRPVNPQREEQDETTSSQG